MAELSSEDLRERLFNALAVGPASTIQLPREAVTSVRGLMIDLDADLLKPNPWFPPADTAETFYAGIAPALNRHPILQHAEIRNTGRWLHALVWFREPVELRSAAEQHRWKGLHQVLMASVPSDPSAPALIGLTRPVGSINGKTNGVVATLKPGVPITGEMLETWAKDVRAKPFETIGLPLFGARRIAPCPYCGAAGSRLDLGEVEGLCYGPCRRVNTSRIFEPFIKPIPSLPGKTAAPAKRRSGAKDKKDVPETTDVNTPVIKIDRDVILQIDPAQVGRITIRVGNIQNEEEGK
jgi:hypothetical protein